MAAVKTKKVQICKFCGCSLKGVSPIKPFSPIYDRMCPERDYDPCERVERRR